MAKARILGKSWADDVTLTATSEGLPVANLQGTDVRKVWRSTAATDQNVDVDFGRFRGPTWVYLENINYDHNMTVTVKLSSDNFSSFSYTATLDIWQKHVNYWAAQHFFSGNPLARYMRLVFSGSSHPDGFFEAGRLKVGAYVDGPNSKNIAVGPSYRLDERALLTGTRGGGFHSEQKAPRTRLDVTWRWIHDTDAWAVEAESFADFLEHVGHRDDMVISLAPEEGDDREQRWTILGRMSENSGLDSHFEAADLTMRHSLSITVIGNAGRQLARSPAAEQLAWYIHGSPLVSLPTTARSGSSGYVPNGAGVLENYGASTPIEINGNAVWCQPAGSNDATYSEQFDNAAWTKLGVVVGANEAVAPDGATTADAFDAANTSASEHYAARTFAISLGGNTWFATSVFVKAGAVDHLAIAMLDNAFVGVRQYFDLSGGVEASADDFNAPIDRASGMESLGNGWYRCWVAQLVASARTSMSVRIGAANADLGRIYAAADTTTAQIYVFGAQFEEGASRPTAYLPITGSTDTTNATEPYIPWPSGLTSNFAGSFIWRPAWAGQGTIWLLGNYTDGNNAFGVLHNGTNIIFRNRVSGSNNDATKALAYAANTDYEIHFRHDAINGLDIAVDEVKGTNDSTTTAVTAATNAFIGQDGNDAAHMLGSVRELKIFGTRQGISDAEWLAL